MPEKTRNISFFAGVVQHTRHTQTVQQHMRNIFFGLSSENDKVLLLYVREMIIKKKAR